MSDLATVRRILEAGLPPVTLLTELPERPTAAELAEHLFRHHGIAAVDRFVSGTGPVSIDLVRGLIRWAARAPFCSPFRLSVIGLDAASPQAQNALLKILEEPPGGMRFILHATRPVLPTVASRAQHYQLGHLREHAGTDTDPRVRDQVLALVAALAARDRAAAGRALAGWREDHHRLLGIWLVETATRRWRCFSAADAAGLADDPARVWALLRAVNALPAARSRLGVRAALEPFLR